MHRITENQALEIKMTKTMKIHHATQLLLGITQICPKMSTYKFKFTIH